MWKRKIFWFLGKLVIDWSVWGQLLFWEAQENFTVCIQYRRAPEVAQESVYQCRRRGFDPWVGKIPWWRKWQPTPVFLPGETPSTEEPGRLQSIGSQGVGHEWETSLTIIDLIINKHRKHISYLIYLCVKLLEKRNHKSQLYLILKMQ